MQERRKQTAHKTGCSVEQGINQDAMVKADDEFLR
jgi:hypothetical protein